MNNIYRIILPAALVFFLLMSIDASAILDYEISVTTLDNPSPGYIFIAPVAEDTLKIIDNSGNQVFLRQFQMPSGGMSFIQYTNINIWPNGWMSFYVLQKRFFYIFDENMNLVDSVQAVDGAETDGHELRLLPNGHYVILGVRYTKYDLSKIFSTGNPNGQIMDNVIQELDKNKNLLFEWKASDHLNVADVIDTNDISGSIADPFHINSVDVDSDGNFLISARHTDEITKISRATGNFLWRMGGMKCKNNQFSFLGDSVDNFVGFSHQHDARWLSNGHIMLFDNGNLKDNQYSRAVEYKIDEVNRTVTKVWEYRNSPDIYTAYMGNVQRLPNGNTLIGWGGSTQFDTQYSNIHNIAVTEVKSDETKVFEMSLKGNESYRAYRYVYQMAAVTKEISSNGTYEFNESSKNQTALTMNIDNLSGSGQLTTELHYYEPNNISYTDSEPCGIFGYRWVISKDGVNSASGTMKFDISMLPKLYSPDNIQVYQRSSEDSGSFKLVSTKYNSSTNKIEATTSCIGEFLMGLNELIKPTLILPPDNSTNMLNKFVASWEKNNSHIKGVYNIQLSDNSTFDKPFVDQNLNDINSYEFSNLDYNKDYYWRVKVQYNSCESRWSEISHFRTTLREPSLDLPASSSYDNPVNGTISWFSVDGALKYKVLIANNPNFDSSAIVVDRNISGILWLQYTNLEYNKEYFWRVKAINDIAESDWSSVAKFTTILASPENVSPANDAKGISVNGVLIWKKVSGAELYKVEIDTTNEFSRPVVSESGIVQDTFKFAGLKNNTTYYWHIKAVNHNSRSDWSVSSKFTSIHPAPALSVPQNNSIKIAVNGSVIWKGVAEAKKYRVQISTEPDFSTTIYDESDLFNTVFNYKNLAENTEYYWRVNATSDYGTSDWSVTWNFFTRLKSILSSPVLISPTDYYVKMSKDEKLVWTYVQGASKYWLQISTNEEFSDLIVDDENITGTSYPLNNLNYDTKYFWRVSALNSETTSDWSETWTFLTIIAMPSLTLPANNSSNIPVNGTLNWEKVEGASTYKVQLSDDVNFGNIIFELDNIESLMVDYPLLETNKQYWWRVSAKNANTESDWSEIWNFKTNNPLGINDNLNSRTQTKILYYPNPCLNKLSIDININRTENISIIIYDVLGFERARLKNDYLQAGNYHHEWDTEYVENGTYFCHYLVGSYMEIVKIIINK